jgi:4'-phosphopantetheinyl transferase EntD
MAPSVLRSIFGEAAGTAEAPVHAADEALYPQELAYIAGASPTRQAEFGTGRVCARRALAELGVAPCALVSGGDGVPLWPPGVVGSISHTRKRCAVVVARETDARSVGLDIEEIRALESGVEETILTARERSFLRERAPALHDELLILFFSGKEAYYKCQYPVTGRFLDFRDVELGLDLDARTFVARSLEDGARTIGDLQGRFAFDRGMVLCGVELPALRRS